MTDKALQWGDVLTIYLDVLERRTGKRPKVRIVNTNDSLSEKEHYYQIHFDRMNNRIFDNSKIKASVQDVDDFVDPRDGLEKCLCDFLESDKKFLYRRWKFEAALDRITGEKESLSNIKNIKDKFRYFIYRYLVRP